MGLPIARTINAASWSNVQYGRAMAPRLWSNGVLGRNGTVPNDSTLALTEPSGSIPTHIKGRISGWGEPPNISATAATDVVKLQGFIRQAERGDTYNLFTYYRDSVLGNSHIQSEAAKRKMVVVGQPFSLQPFSKESADDKKARDVISAMIECCENWDQGLMAISDAHLWPVAINEKIFSEQMYEYPMLQKLGCRLALKRFEPVNPALISYRVAYMGAGASMAGPNWVVPQNYTPLPSSNISEEDAQVWNPDDWNADIRIYATYPNGIIDFSPSDYYKLDPMRHLVFRESSLAGIRDNMGGPWRSLVFWNFLWQQARDWFARDMQRFGAPFTVIYANMTQSDTAQALQQQLNLASQVKGLVLPIGAKAELEQTNTAGMAEGFKMFIDLCADECSKVICGQVSSAGQRKSSGGDKGSEKLQSDVRDDLAQYDKQMLNTVLRQQLFQPFLRLNGFSGQAPRIVFGGHDPAGLQMKTQAIGTLFGAGMEPTDEGMETLSQEIGVDLQRAPVQSTPVNGEKDKNKIPSSKRN